MRNDALCCMQHAATRPALRVLHAGTSIGESSFITPALRCVRACPKLQPEHPVHSAIRQLHTGGMVHAVGPASARWPSGSRI